MLLRVIVRFGLVAICALAFAHPARCGEPPHMRTDDVDSTDTECGLNCILGAEPIFSNFPNIPIDHSVDWTQSEMSIAIDPLDASNFLVGANTSSLPWFTLNDRQGTFWSNDGASSWVGYYNYPPSELSGSDPAVAYDRFGTAYFNFLETYNDAGIPRRKVVLVKAINGEPNWTTRYEVPNISDADKNHLAIQYKGNRAYTAFTDQGKIYFAWQQGTDPFSSP